MPILRPEIKILRNNVPYCTLSLLSIPTVKLNNEQEIKMQLNFSFLKDEKIDFLTDRIEAYLWIDDMRCPLGKYLASECPEDTKSIATGSVVAYDYTYLLKQSCIEERLYIPAGTKYTDAVRNQFILSGITNFFIEDSNLTIPVDREDWDVGVSRLQIINELLAEINYNSVWADLFGIIKATAKKRITAKNIDFSYQANKFTMLYGEHQKNRDIFSRPNVFRLYCNHPELGDMVAVAENNDPASPISTVNIKRRILANISVDNIANQAELQNKADLMMFDSLLPTETVTIKTGPYPRHSCYNIVALQKDDISGIFEEKSWSLTLGDVGEMTHVIKRVLV